MKCKEWNVREVGIGLLYWILFPNKFRNIFRKASEISTYTSM